MAIKKSELYSKLWESCDELRGSMDASQYKDYILVLLFMKYVSDKYADDPNSPIEIPEGTRFEDMIALKGTKDIGEKLNTMISKLAEANELKGVIDVADFDDNDKLGSGKDMQDKLSKLIAIFQDEGLNFSKNRADGDDILGDAYEYLMRNFATDSGKSKGQFYTPAEVSRVMAKVIGIEKASSSDQTIYDPTCGSGSLLLKASDEAPVKVSIYGQENDNATRALSVMNMWLHGCPSAEIWKGNTLSEPYFKDDEGNLKTFDFAVANPPFSFKSWSNGVDTENDPYKRFEGFGVPPSKNGDYAFLLHFIRSLKSTGKGAIILPHGVLFRGNVEAEIRKNIIKRGYIKGIIGLPANLFYGTGIPACILIVDKQNANNRKGIFMIDASKGFIKDGNKNRLREQDIHKIVDVFTKQLEIPKYSSMVSVKDIEEKHEFNLNIPRYIDTQEEEDIHDIEAHLKGGIPNYDVEKLASYWDVCPSLRDDLFALSEREKYSKLKVSQEQIKTIIFNHTEFVSYRNSIEKAFSSWKSRNESFLKNIAVADHPKEIIFKLSEALLEEFKGKQLINSYDVYQHLLDYWNETMKDDVYILVEDGWKAEIHLIIDKKGKQKDWGCDLVPKELVIEKYFKEEKQNLLDLDVALEDNAREMEELCEEQSGDDGLLEEVKNDKGNITKAVLQKRIREIKNNTDYEDELKVLKQYESFLASEAECKKKIKEDNKDLDTKLVKKYKELTPNEIKLLVVCDKWMKRLETDIKEELDRVSQNLTNRIKELSARYAMPLPKQISKVNELEGKVNAHLEKMGFVWN